MNSVNAIDLYKTTCTLFGSANGYLMGNHNNQYIQKEMSLIEILKLCQKLKDTILKIRSLEYHSEQYNTAKLKLPCFVLGRFEGGKSDNDLIEKPPLIIIDIDNVENIDKARKQIFDLPYVLGTPLSVSGLGFYALVAVENGELRKQYYEEIVKTWNIQYNINVDTNANSIGRKRFCSYEKNITKWLKPVDTQIFKWDYISIKSIRKNNSNSPDVILQKTKSGNLFSNNDFQIKCVKKALECLNNNLLDYNDWEILAERLKNFDYDFYDEFCECCSKSPRAQRRKGYKTDLKGLKRVFNKEKTHTQDEEIAYFYSVLKKEFGKKWVTCVE